MPADEPAADLGSQMPAKPPPAASPSVTRARGALREPQSQDTNGSDEPAQTAEPEAEKKTPTEIAVAAALAAARSTLEAALQEQMKTIENELRKEAVAPLVAVEDSNPEPTAHGANPRAELAGTGNAPQPAAPASERGGEHHHHGGADSFQSGSQPVASVQLRSAIARADAAEATAARMSMQAAHASNQAVDLTSELNALKQHLGVTSAFDLDEVQAASRIKHSTPRPASEAGSGTGTPWQPPASTHHHPSHVTFTEPQRWFWPKGDIPTFNGEIGSGNKFFFGMELILTACLLWPAVADEGTEHHPPAMLTTAHAALYQSLTGRAKPLGNKFRDKARPWVLWQQMQEFSLQATPARTVAAKAAVLAVKYIEKGKNSVEQNLQLFFGAVDEKTTAAQEYDANYMPDNDTVYQLHLTNPPGPMDNPAIRVQLLSCRTLTDILLVPHLLQRSCSPTGD